MVAAGLLAAGALLFGSPQTGADPRDWVPYCWGDQTPIDDNCNQMAHQVFTHDAPGANPQLPTGLAPDEAPITGEG